MIRILRLPLYRIRLITALVLVFLPLASDTVFAEDNPIRSYSSPKYEFSLTYPDYLEAKHVPEAAFFASSSTSGFPTLNILVNEGHYDLQETIADQAEAALNSYRLVGLIDAHQFSTPAELLSTPHGTAFRTFIAYTQADEKLVAVLTIFATKNRHFFVTFVVREKDFGNYQETFDLVAQSFSAPNLIRVTAHDEARNPYSLPPLAWIGLLCSLIISVLLLLGMVRRFFSIKN